MKQLRELFAGAALLFMIGVLAVHWSSLPPQVPMHFGLAGNPDGSGPKSGLIILAAIAVFSYVILTVIPFFPAYFSYPVAVTERNRARLQELAIGLVSWIKLEITFLFAWLTATLVRVALGRATGLGFLFVPALLLIVLVTAAVFIRRMFAAGE